MIAEKPNKEFAIRLYFSRIGNNLHIHRIMETPAKEEPAVTGTITAQARQSSAITPKSDRSGMYRASR